MKLPTLTFKKIKSLLLTAFVWLLIVEVLLRLILPVPFFQPKNVLPFFYPEYKKVKARTISNKDDVYDVLILGGSVVASYYPIEKLLHQKLKKQFGRPVKIHNVSEPAHTSLDSYFKYKQLNDKAFDLVLFYHGINETRANNCPDEVFKADYSHYSWYRALYAAEQHPELNWTVLPYTLHYLWIYLKEFTNASDLIHFKNIEEDWMKYGAEVKTAVSFQKNINRILEIAKAKNEPVLLMDFAYYIPENYSKEKFLKKELDYTTHNRAIEIWGKPELVEHGIQVHNQVIQNTATVESGVYRLDQNALLAKAGENFLDICHLTEAGSEVWVNNLVAYIASKPRLSPH